MKLAPMRLLVIALLALAAWLVPAGSAATADDLVYVPYAHSSPRYMARPRQHHGYHRARRHRSGAALQHRSGAALRHRRHARVRAYVRRERDDEPGVRCLRPVRAVGAEAYTQKGAQKIARRTWEGAVRFDHGDKYMDIRNAQDVRYQCGRSSNNTTIIGRMGESLPGVGLKEISILDRCVLTARPCTGGVILGDDAQLEADE